MEEGKERMVKTPWYDYEIPFHQAAEMGTQKVIRDHSTIGLLVTCDGSFGEIPRENFVQSEERTVAELSRHVKKTISYHFKFTDAIQGGNKTDGSCHAGEVSTSVVAVNCEQLKKDDIIRILEKILYEFPIRQMSFTYRSG